MSLDASQTKPRRAAARVAVARREPGAGGSTFSTALFTGLNVAVFLILAACVVGAAILYSQGA